jgi:N-acetylneuraminic acid mutarotase
MPLVTADGVTGVIDAKLYVLPGTCPGEFWPSPGWCEQPQIRKLFRYDPAKDAWTQMAKCPHFHANGAGGVIKGKFYVAGGSGRDYLDAYDPATNTWKTLAFLPTAGAVIGAVLHEEFYVISGTNTYAYNPVTNRWKTKASTTWPHDAVAQVRFDGTGHLLAVGGVHAPASTANDSELYTP